MFAQPRVEHAEYALAKDGTRHRATYNSYALFVAILWLLWPLHLCPLWLVTLQCASLAAALLLDVHGPDPHPLCIADLPTQLSHYTALVRGVLGDMWMLWLGSLAVFAVFRRVSEPLVAALFGYPLGVILYIVYLLTRSLYLAVVLAATVVSRPRPRLLAPHVSIRSVGCRTSQTRRH